jgi:hypothetical protein
MLNRDPDKNWVIWLFITAFAFIVLYTLWPYIVAGIVLYAIAKGFSSHQSNHNRRCRRRCRRWRRW